MSGSSENEEKHQLQIKKDIESIVTQVIEENVLPRDQIEPENAHLIEEGGSSSHSNHYENIPTAAWSRRLDQGFKPHKQFQVSIFEGLRLIGLGYRMWKYHIRERAAGRVPIIDPFSSPTAGPIMGVPLGGIGGGSIGRGWRGDFVKWQVGPAGMVQIQRVDADQFSVYIETEDNIANPPSLDPQEKSIQK